LPSIDILKNRFKGFFIIKTRQTDGSKKKQMWVEKKQQWEPVAQEHNQPPLAPAENAAPW